MTMIVEHSESTSTAMIVIVGVGTVGTGQPPSEMPASIPADQLYYWTSEWQREEQKSLAEIAAGQGKVFNSARDAIGWLMDEADED